MITETVRLITDLTTILVILVGAIMAIFVYFQFTPILQLRILPNWADDSKQYLVIRFEVENKSRVRMHQPWGQIQVLKYKVQPGFSLSHWVPFEKTAVKPSEEPIEWSDPTKIFTSTKDIYPGETIVIERLYHCPEETIVFHVGLQVGAKLNFFERILTGNKKASRQTTTCFVVK